MSYKKIKKLTALMLVTAMICQNLPKVALFATDTSNEDEMVSFEVTVTGEDDDNGNNKILDAIFSIDGEDIEADCIEQQMNEVVVDTPEDASEEGTEEENIVGQALEEETDPVTYEPTNIYTITIPKPEEGTTITVYQDGYKNYRDTITYIDDMASYEAKLIRYADITEDCIEDNGISVDGAEYSKTVTYGDNNNQITLAFGDIVECTSDITY